MLRPVAGTLAAAAVAAGAFLVVPGTAAGAGEPAPARTPLLTALPAVGASPSAAGVARALASAARAPALGGALSAVVVDPRTGGQLFARSPARPQPPASTAKLLTALAALDALGPAATLSTGVVRAGHTLWLVGGGDVTLAARPATGGYPAPARLRELAERTAAALGTGAQVRLLVDTSAWTGPPQAPGWNPGYFSGGDIAALSPLEVDEGRRSATGLARVGDPAAAAARQFRQLLTGAGVRVAGRTRSGAAPSGALGVAAVSSPPVAALVQRMLTDSDNDLAEALGRAVALHDTGVADFAHEAAAIRTRVVALGIPAAGVRLSDASGLSRLDAVSADALVAALRVAGDPQRPQLRPVLEGLPVAGLTGTLADRYRGALTGAGAGVVRAKTGTLSGVNSLAGQVVDADGRLLLFAFLTDRAVSPQRSEPALDRLAAILAGCGCR